METANEFLIQSKALREAVKRSERSQKPCYVFEVKMTLAKWFLVAGDEFTPEAQARYMSEEGLGGELKKLYTTKIN